MALLFQKHFNHFSRKRSSLVICFTFAIEPFHFNDFLYGCGQCSFLRNLNYCSFFVDVFQLFLEFGNYFKYHFELFSLILVSIMDLRSNFQKMINYFRRFPKFVNFHRLYYDRELY